MYEKPAMTSAMPNQITTFPSQVDERQLQVMLLGALPFINGGVAGMFATSCIQPIDMVKVRVQLTAGARTSPVNVLQDVIKRHAWLELYTGLSAALLRQATYTTTRIGLFHRINKFLEERALLEGRKIGFLERASAGITAGGIAATVGNPADLALVRMQADKFRPVEQRRHYRGVMDALFRIVKEEGLMGLWTGARPTVIRAMAMNFGQLAFFSDTKERLKENAPQASQSIHLLGASASAGFFAAIFSLPFDFLKTRLQEQNQQTGMSPRYRGMLDCAHTVLKSEGPLAFYRGFGTYYLRVAPQAMITLVVADCLNLLTL